MPCITHVTNMSKEWHNVVGIEKDLEVHSRCVGSNFCLGGTGPKERDFTD